MHHTIRARLGTAALLVSALGLLAPAAAPSSAAPAAHHPTARVAAHTPTLTFKINRAGKIRLTHGPRTFRPGRVAFHVTSRNQNATLAFVQFHRGYGFKAFRNDIAKAFGKGDMAAFKHAIRNTTLLGGAGGIAPGGTSGTVVLPKDGTYTVYNFGGDLPMSPLALHAVGRLQHRAAPRTTGTLTALTGIRFGGATTLSRHGTLLLKNRASDSPHMFVMIRVQPGTTKQQIVDSFQSPSSGQPSWAIGPGPASEVVGPHRSMTLNYRTPAGSYALMCFFPDPNQGGMPHAAMGMVRMLTVK